MSVRKWINRFSMFKQITYLDKGLDFFVNKMEKNEHFSFSRFGDGEWNAILGKAGENCDGHAYFPEMGKLLACTLKNPLGYMYSIQKTAIMNDGRAIAAFLRKYQVQLPWYNSNVFHYANWYGTFFPLIDQLRKKEMVIIGPAHLKGLGKEVFKYEHFVEIPPKNCFLEMHRIRDDIVNYGKDRKNIVYSFSASMSANILIHDLFPFLGANNWMLDFGSVWDIYVGTRSRGHYNKGDWDAIIKKNLGTFL